MARLQPLAAIAHVVRCFENDDCVASYPTSMLTAGRPREPPADLNCLIGRGWARRRTTAEGVWLYEAA